jgi:fucose 4-O-acetylase-like acetyltransferase
MMWKQQYDGNKLQYSMQQVLQKTVIFMPTFPASYMDVQTLTPWKRVGVPLTEPVSTFNLLAKLTSLNRLNRDTVFVHP